MIIFIPQKMHKLMKEFDSILIGIHIIFSHPILDKNLVERLLRLNKYVVWRP